MPLRTARFYDSAEVTIDEQLCNGCGLCVKVCRGAPLVMEGKRVKVDQSLGFGCIACGHCVTICPKNAITVRGRDFGPEDVSPMPKKEARADYDSLRNLLLSRRSVRDFKDKPVEREFIDKILEAASSAPMGLPPSDVQVLVFEGFEQVQALRNDLYDEMKKWRWMTRGVGAILMRPFMSKAASEAMREFVGPVIDMYEQKANEGVDWFLYGAPLALYFYTSPYADPVDPYIPATYAMLAAQSLGLGSTMLGFPGMVIMRSKLLQKKYGIDAVNGSGLMLIVGHPAVRFSKVVTRRFRGIHYFPERLPIEENANDSTNSEDVE